MRILLLLVMILSLPAADLVHGRLVLTSGEELVGWWDADARAVYLPNGRYAYVPTNEEIKAVRTEAPPEGKAKPAKRAFPLPVVEFCTVRDNGREFTGWWIDVSKTIHIPQATQDQEPDVRGLGADAVVVARVPPPWATPARVLLKQRVDAVLHAR